VAARLRSLGEGGAHFVCSKQNKRHKKVNSSVWYYLFITLYSVTFKLPMLIEILKSMEDVYTYCLT